MVPDEEGEGNPEDELGDKGEVVCLRERLTEEEGDERGLRRGRREVGPRWWLVGGRWWNSCSVLRP